MKKAITLLLAALLVFSFAGCKGVQVLQTNAFVFGVITDEAGAPIEGATVTLIQGDKTAVDKDDNSFTKFEATTDAEGRYKLGEYETKEAGRQTISNGQYILEIIADGKITMKTSGNVADLTVSELGVAMGLFGSFGNGPEYTDYYLSNHTLKAPYTLKGKLYAIKGTIGANLAAVMSNGSLAAGAKISAKIDPYGTGTTTTISSTVSDTGEYSLSGLYVTNNTTIPDIPVMVNYESADVIYDINDVLSIDSTGMADFTSNNVVVNDRNAGTEFPIASDANLVIASGTAISTFKRIATSLSTNYAAMSNSYSGVAAAVSSAAPTFTFTYNKDVASVVGFASANMYLKNGATAIQSSASIDTTKRIVTITPAFPLYNSDTYSFSFTVYTADGESVSETLSFTTAGASVTVATPTGLAANADYADTQAYVEWSKVSGADKYYIFGSIDGKDMTLITSTDASVDSRTIEQRMFNPSTIPTVDTSNPFSYLTSYKGKVKIGVIAVSGSSVSSMATLDISDNHSEVMLNAIDGRDFTFRTGNSITASYAGQTESFSQIDFGEPVNVTLKENIADSNITAAWVWDDSAHTKGKVHLSVTYSATSPVTGIIASTDNVQLTVTDAAGNQIALNPTNNLTRPSSYTFQITAQTGALASTSFVSANTTTYPTTTF